jgi:hypothetical protein
VSSHSKETREPGSKTEPGSKLKYDAGRAAPFYDEYGEREWTRFEDGRTPSASAATHTMYLERFVTAGDRVLDAGCGPGRFTLELARLGAKVVAVDAREKGSDVVERVTSTGILTPGLGAHGLTMKMYRWRELRDLLEPHGEIVAAAATGIVLARPEEPELRALSERIELDLGAEPGAIDAGHHILAVVRT